MTRRALFSIPLAVLAKPLAALIPKPRYIVLFDLYYKWTKGYYVLQEFGNDWTIIVPEKYCDLSKVWQGSKSEAEQVCKITNGSRIVPLPRRFWKF